MAAFHGNSIIGEEALGEVFVRGDDLPGDPSFCFTTRTFADDEITSRTRERLANLAAEPGMSAAAGVDYTPAAGEFCMLVLEGEADHVCAALVYRLSVSEGAQRTGAEAWHERRPGPTVNLKLDFRAACVRRHNDPRREQKLQAGIAAGIAQTLTRAVRCIDERLADFGRHAWITVGVGATCEMTPQGDVSPSLLRTIRQAVDNEVVWICEDGNFYPGLDMVEAT